MPDTAQDTVTYTDCRELLREISDLLADVSGEDDGAGGG